MVRPLQLQPANRRGHTPWAEFSRAYPIWVMIDEEKDRLAHLTSEAERKRIERNIERLTRLVVPRESVTRWVRWKPIVAKCREYFRRHGAPKDIRKMYKWMQDEGVMRGANEHGKEWFVSETKFRVILHEVFHIGLKKRRENKI